MVNLKHNENTIKHAFTGNDDAFLSDGGCKQQNHLPRFHRRKCFSRVAQAHIAAFLCARHLRNISHLARTPCSARHLIQDSQHPHRARRLLHICSLQSGLPLLLRCLADFAQQSTLTKSEAQREYRQAKVRKGSKLFFNASKDVKLIEVRS